MIVPVRYRQQGVGTCLVDQALAHQTVSRLGGGVDVLQPHLVASHRLAILGAGDHDLPQLLGAALLDRLDKILQAPHPLELGGVERWMVYPVLLWLVGFGGYLTAHRQEEAPSASLPATAAQPLSGHKEPARSAR